MEKAANKVVKDFTTKSGLRALIILARGSHHCGYVAVDKNHALHGVDYYSLVSDIDVHGNLTYSDEKDKYPGLWWFGFDCAHVGDRVLCEDRASQLSNVGQLSDLLGGGLDSGGTFGHGVFRDADYVEKECESMAQQLNTYLDGSQPNVVTKLINRITK